MAVGIADVDELRRFRIARRKERGGSWVYTRNHPRRADEILATGGSIYWVIRGKVQVRQRVVGFRSEHDEKGRTYCLIDVDPHLVATLWRPWRPFQGWRYLKPADAPPDAPSGLDPAAERSALPERMIAELRALGLW